MLFLKLKKGLKMEINLDAHDNIIIVNLEISNRKDVDKIISEDVFLVDAIVDFISILEDEDVEIYKVEKNILITEDGFYAAVYENSVNLKSEE